MSPYTLNLPYPIFLSILNDIRKQQQLSNLESNLQMIMTFSSDSETEQVL